MKKTLLILSLILFWVSPVYPGPYEGTGADDTSRLMIIPNSATPPTSPACSEGQVYDDSNATSGQRLLLCEGGTWVAQGASGAATSLALSSNPGNCSAGQAAGGIDTTGAAETCIDPIVATEMDSLSEFLTLSGTTSTGTGSKFVLDTNPTIIGPTIAALANLTSNGFIKTGGGIGTLSVDTSTYAASTTAGGPATTATALASDPGNCSAGSVAGGITAAGVAESCLDPIVSTEIDSLSEFLAITGLSSTGTGNFVLATSPTNVTLDVEGTGNNITTVPKIWLAAANCQNTTPTIMWDLPTSSPAVAACITGTNTQKGVADFADSASLSMQQTIALPSDWSGAIDAKFKWLTTATSGSVVWQIATICVADAETDDPAFNTASTVTDAAKGTTNQTNDASITGVTATGCAAGELMHIKVLRDSAHASDSLAATARLIGVELTLRRTQ